MKNLFILDKPNADELIEKEIDKRFHSFMEEYELPEQECDKFKSVYSRGFRDCLELIYEEIHKYANSNK